MDRPTLEWVGPDGVAYNLGNWTTNRYFALEGVAGVRAAAPRTIVADDSPRGGTVPRHIQPGPRLITLPVYFEGDDHTAMVTLERELAESFASTRWRGAGQLRVLRPDGSARQIDCWYEDGWDPDGNPTQGTTVLTLYCADPFWRATTQTPIIRAYDDSGADFLDPYPTISSSQALGSGSVTNPGSVEAWPDWVITGPASLVTITNSTTGETFTIDPNAAGIAWGNLMAAQTVTVTTNPPSVTGPDGSVWTAALNWPTAELWGLDPGVSSVEVTAAGAGSGTSVTGTFYARYETA